MVRPRKQIKASANRQDIGRKAGYKIQRGSRSQRLLQQSKISFKERAGDGWSLLYILLKLQVVSGERKLMTQLQLQTQSEAGRNTVTFKRDAPALGRREASRGDEIQS